MSVNVNSQLILSKDLADTIIKSVGGTGQPPRYGFQFFTVGLEDCLTIIDEEYISSHIKKGGGSFKLIVGSYGGGKTHFLYNIRELAWKNNFVVAYIELGGSKGAPFNKLEEIYKKIVASIEGPLTPEQILQDSIQYKGIESLLKKWYYEKIEELDKHFSNDRLGEEVKNYLLRGIGPYESTSFQNAVKHSFQRLFEGDEEEFSLILQWLKGENPSKTDLRAYRISDKIDKSTAFKMLRCLNSWIKDIGYSGLIVMMDETEAQPSLSSKEKITLLVNLRELVDASVREEIKYAMFFYAVPNIDFMEGNANVYTALKDRLNTVFNTEVNPNGAQIRLEDIWKDDGPVEMLVEMGRKLAKIYEVSKEMTFEQEKLEAKIRTVAESCYEQKFADINYRRKFAQSIIVAFGELRKEQMK